MKLPAELKNQIYGLALRDENGIFLISKTIAYRHTVQRSRPYGYDESNGRRRHSRHSYLLEQQTDTDPEAPPPASLHPNILRVSREMYAETQPILYGNNAFTFEDTTALHGFLAKIGRQIPPFHQRLTSANRTHQRLLIPRLQAIQPKSTDRNHRIPKLRHPHQNRHQSLGLHQSPQSHELPRLHHVRQRRQPRERLHQLPHPLGRPEGRR